jgi:hypothetical protein
MKNPIRLTLVAVLVIFMATPAFGNPLLLRFTALLSFITASNALFNTLGDYEESQLSAGVDMYYSQAYQYYYGSQTQITRRNWVDSNGAVLYLTETSTSSGGSSSHSNPFYYVPERRDYLCQKFGTVNGAHQMVMEQRATVRTDFWARHSVVRYPNNSANTSPSSFGAHLRLGINWLTSTCDGQAVPPSTYVYDSFFQTRNSLTAPIAMMAHDAEVYALGVGIGYVN